MKEFADKAMQWADLSLDGDAELARLDAAAEALFTSAQVIGSVLADDTRDAVVFFAARRGLMLGIMPVESRDALERLKRTRHMHLSAVIPEYLRDLAKSEPVDAFPEIKFSAPVKFSNTGSKFGGTPDFIQNDAEKLCRGCGRKMAFLAQIDSMPEVINIVDDGMVYVFYCDHCFLASADVQFH